MQRSGSVVESWTGDRGAAGSSLINVTVLCPWARHINPSLVLVQPRKTRPNITERLLMGCKESNTLYPLLEAGVAKIFWILTYFNFHLINIFDKKLWHIELDHVLKITNYKNFLKIMTKASIIQVFNLRCITVENATRGIWNLTPRSCNLFHAQHNWGWNFNSS